MHCGPDAADPRPAAQAHCDLSFLTARKSVDDPWSVCMPGGMANLRAVSTGHKIDGVANVVAHFV